MDQEISKEQNQEVFGSGDRTIKTADPTLYVGKQTIL